MGAEQSSQQRAEADGREIFESDPTAGSSSNKTNKTSTKQGTTTAQSRSNTMAPVPGARHSSGAGNNKRHSMLIRQGSSNASSSRQGSSVGGGGTINSPTTSSRAPSPPLSVCSDLPYVSYTDRPIGDSPKIRNKQQASLQNSSTGMGSGNAAATRNANMANRRSYPGGIKPKRPQSTASAHSIVIVKPGARDTEIDSDLATLQNIPQFLPVLRESITSATFTRDPEVLERLQAQHLLNICSRLQQHLNICATHAASEQNRLVERTKIVSNSITSLFASFVDMQKTYAAYAEQFSKIRSITHQLSRCNSLLHENIASLEVINNFLEPEDRLEPFVWRTDDGDDRRRQQQQQQHSQQRRGEAEGACATDAASVVGGVVRVRRT